MSERESELRFLARNVEAVETVATSAIMSQIVSLMAQEGKHRVIDILEFNQLISGYNKIDDAIVELKNLIHQMNGTQAEPEPHGSRDTFSPETDPGEAFWARMRERDDEHYNAMQD
jgi:hypothetical protein